MGGEIVVSSVIVVISLFLLAALSAIILKKINFPYTIGLVVVGIILGFLALHVKFLEPLQHIKLTPELILYILLPTLIFEASVNIDSRMLMKNVKPVLVLAAPGLVLSTVIVGVILDVFTSLGTGGSMLFGALISATDPVACIALFRELGAPKRLTLLVDGESLFNDATAIVVFNIVMKMIMAGAVISFMTFFGATFNFMYVFFGGIAVGAVIGYIMIKTIAFAKNDPVIEVALSTVVAYTAFIIADRYFKVSGVMSVMGAGIVVSWFGATRFTPKVKEYMSQFWEFGAFAANSFIFLLLGMTENMVILDLGHYSHLVIYILIAIAAVLVARAAVIFLLVPLIGKLPKSDPVSMKFQTVMFWGGLRGAVPLALVLSLPSDFPHRRMIIEITLGVVLFTLLVQGTTMKRLIAFLGLNKMSLFDRITALQAFLKARRRAFDKVSELQDTRNLSNDILQDFIKIYSEKNTELIQLFDNFKEEDSFRSDALPNIIWSQAIATERRTYRELFESGLISETVFRELELCLDLHLDKIVKHEKFRGEEYLKPVKTEMKSNTMKIVGLFAPNSRFFRYLQLRKLGTNHERYLAGSIAIERIKLLLDQLQGVYPDAEKIIKQCRNFYGHIEHAAEDYLKEMTERYPKQIKNIKFNSVLRYALETESNVISEMLDAGEIDESVASRIETEIDKEMELSSNHQYLKLRHFKL